jgi:Spy/CpxP family protein refolding chaperone
MKEAIKDLGDLALKPAQRDAITKLRKDSDKTVAEAKRQLDQLAGKLHDSLGNKTVTDAEVAKYVDQISAQEAVIRKARLIAWVNARRVLDDAQRKRVEDAANKK